MIYLDNAATTFPKSESVYLKMDEVSRNLCFNAGRGVYKAARKANDIIEQTREKILMLAGANKSANVIFTSSATIALNQIIGGINFYESDTVYVSPFEHNAVMRALYLWQKRIGFTIKELPLIIEGESLHQRHELDLESIRFEFARRKPSYVFMSHVSNVTGYILPIEAVGKIAKEYEAKVIVDGSQAFGIVEINLNSLPVDAYVFAGHKTCYGPFGIAGFILKSNFALNLLIAGGNGSDSLNLEMPREGSARFETGSENIVAIAGLKAALDEREDKVYEKEKELTDFLVFGIERINNIYTYLPKENSHIGIVSFNIRSYKAVEVGHILDDDFDIAVRAGYHCAPLIHEYLNDKLFAGTVRASVGKFTTKNDIEVFLKALKDLAEEI